MNSEAIDRVVHVVVNTIENIAKRDAVTIKILIYHNEILIGESDSLKIEPDFREPPTINRIDYSTDFHVIVTDKSSIDAAVSIPLLIQVIEHLGNAESGSSFSATEDGRRREKMKSGRKSNGSNKEKRIIGNCNVDIIPIILGEKIIIERLIVEEPKQFSTTIGNSWLNLPILTITLTHDETNFLPQDLRVNSINITIESIYNPPASFNENAEYKAATISCTDDEEARVVIFEGGKFSKYRDVELTKRWRSLSKLEGRGKLSKYKIDCDYGNIKNPLTNVDLKNLLESDKPRIEWNYMSRHMLSGTDEKALKERLNKYKFWPFQFKVTGNVSESGKTKSRDLRPQFYQCYADVSELLYPGKNQTRLVAQLYSSNPTEMMEKTGLDKVLFDDVITETKSKEKKGKFGERGSSINLALLETEVITSFPLTDESGNPVFVIIQFELHQALSSVRTIDELTCDLRELLGPSEKLSPYPYTGDLAEEQYLHCVKKLVEIIIDNYRDFDEEDEKAKRSSHVSHQSGPSTGKKYSYIPDEIDRFTQYLYENGTYVSVQTTLKKNIVRLLDEKFKMQSCTWDSEECQNVVANAYLYLVEQMHVALNDDNEINDENDTHGDADNLCYYAEESYELGNVVQARNYYIDLLTTKKNHPESWIQYAIFSKKDNDVERAVQCCREAINLDSRNKIALLLFGVLQAEKGNYAASEIFFNATTQLYPRFAEAWGVLHLFFLRTEYFPGVDLSIRVAEQCFSDRNRDKIGMKFLENEPLAWSTIHCPENRVYLIIAVFLLKLNLYDFAGIALAQELSLVGRTTSWLYYMAVHHYLLGRYEDALTHLKEARRNYGMDYSISGLMGHCYFKEDNPKLAMECYEFASTLFNRPHDIHLINLRMGNYLLDAEEYNRGKMIFLNLCKTSPTSNSWFGLGIACYELMDFNDAEVALTEANRLNHNDPEIWAYLCILNMSLQRYDEFAECYRQTVKNDLKNAKLWLRITNTMEALGLSSPMLTESGRIDESSENITSELE